MTPLQIAKQVQYLLRQRKWEGNSGYEKVFMSSAVIISTLEVADALGSKPPPYAILNIGSATNDPQVPSLLDQPFSLVLCAMQPGDPFGEYAITGAGRGRGIGASSGKGLAEVEVEAWQAIQLLTQQNGVSIQGWTPSAMVVQKAGESGFIASREYQFRAICTTLRTYLGVTGLTGTGATGGTASLAWTPAPTQWDTFAGSGGQVIRYASGSTPPATVTDGLAGPTVTGVATSAVKTGLASGTWSFSIFTGYAEYDPATVDRYSDPVSVTVTVP